METKFKVGDKVYNLITEEWGTIKRIAEFGNAMAFVDKENKISYFPKDTKFLGFVEEKIKMSDEFYTRPKKPWEELKKEIEGCEKEWVNNEDNYYLVLNHTTHGIREANFNSTIWILENKKYYNGDVRKLVREVEELNYTNEFEKWLLGKEGPKEDYPILTGLEPVGTVGYVDDILSEVSEIREIFSFSCSIYCVFSGTRKCSELFCAPNERSDKKDVYYKKVTKRA